MSKLGLVLGGGGARGAYQVGVVKALRELGLEFDVITGTSVGSLNSVLLVQDKFDELLDLWENITFETVMKHKYKFKNKGLETFLVAPFCNGFSTEPLGELLDKYLDEEAMRNSKVKMGIVTTRRIRKYAPYTIDQIPYGELKNYILTSCAACPFLKKRKINGKTCFDGYFSDNLPVKLATEMGAEKIIAIDILKGFRQKTDNKKVYCFKLKSKYFFLNFKKEVIEELMELGYNDVMKQKNELMDFINSI